jgi:hypothetical protein
MKDDVNIYGDSLTLDAAKTFGIQNLPYLTFIARSSDELSKRNTNEESSHEHSSNTAQGGLHELVALNPLDDLLLQHPSINLLSMWSITQRCSINTLLYHLEQSFRLATFVLRGLKQIKTLRILNDDQQRNAMTYRTICAGDAPDDLLPRTTVIFRFQTFDIPEVN